MAETKNYKREFMSRKEEEVLVECAQNGNTEEAKRLLNLGVSVDAVEFNKGLFYASQNYMTPLQWASLNGHADCVELFIAMGADVNSKDRFDVTAVHLAAENGHHLCLKALLEAEADSNVPTKYSKYGFYTAYPHAGGTTPLHLSSKNNHVECVRELILNGADYNAVDEHGKTSLYIAAELAYEECLITHLRNAIGRDILSLPVKETGDTPLHECVRQGMLDGVRELLKHGSDVNHINQRSGCSPLHLAVQNRDKFSFDIVRELVLNGYNTDVNLPDSVGTTPLHYVCFNDHMKESRRPDVAAFLIAYGAQFENVKDKHGRTILKQEFQQMDRNATILYSIVNSSLQLPSLDSILGTGNVSPNNPQIIQNERVLFMRNQWYRTLCSNPRTLQHICRCSIRTAMGPKRLKFVQQLHLPKSVKEFLLLNYERQCLEVDL